jgi:hypothetical protein
VATELEKIRDRLRTRLTRETRRLNVYDLYFEGEQPLMFVAPELERELGARMTKVVLEWPRFGVGMYDDRLDLRAFRYAGEDAGDDELWRIWQDNDGELISQQINQESLALGRAYAIVGAGDDDDTPLITPESPFDCMHETDPRTREIANGIKQWRDLEGDHHVTLYQPAGRVTWHRPKRGGSWIQDPYVETDFGIAQMVAFINQPRMLGRHRPGHFDQRLGRAEFHSIIPLANAANKMATDMMVSGEFHAMPRRWATGLSADDFVDDNDNPLDTWAQVAGRIWASENEKARVGQFQEADLSNFHETIKLLAQLAGQLLALPADAMGFNSQNPPSADAIRADEARLVKRAERKQRTLGNRYERVQRLVLLTKGESVDKAKTSRIESVWVDAATPTIAQQTDAVTKKVSTKDGQGRSLVPIEQARIDLGYSDEERKRMRDMDDREDPQITAARRALEGAGGGSGSGS